MSSSLEAIIFPHICFRWVHKKHCHLMNPFPVTVIRTTFVQDDVQEKPAFDEDLYSSCHCWRFVRDGCVMPDSYATLETDPSYYIYIRPREDNDMLLWHFDILTDLSAAICLIMLEIVSFITLQILYDYQCCTAFSCSFGFDLHFAQKNNH